MDELSLEMQMHFEQIYSNELKKFVIEIVKKFSKFDPTGLVMELAPEIIARLVEEEQAEIIFLHI